MNTSTKSMILSSVAILLVASVPAQTAGVAGALTGARAAVPLPHPVPPPAINAGAAAQSAATTGASISSAAMPGAASAAASQAARTNVSAASTGPSASATLHASAQGQANGLAVATAVSGGAAATLNVADVVKAIHETSFAARESVTAEIQARIEAGEKLMAALETKAERAGAQAKSDFAKARIEAREKQKELRASLKAATKATKESSWGEVQSQLAKDYSAYAEAMASTEVAAGATAETDAAGK